MLATNRQLDSVLRFYSVPSGGDKRSGLQGLHNGLHEPAREKKRINKPEGALHQQGGPGAFTYGRVNQLGGRTG